jgi:hypothetical protein
VISQPWGGLGDNLQFTTLPQLFTEKGYDVYISSHNVLRNQETFDLVWGKNPYIKGISNLHPNAGACKGYHITTLNPMKNMELMHDLTEGSAEYPIIYYTPKKINDLSNCLLYDITSISASYTDDLISNKFTSIFNKYPHLTKRKIIFNNIKNRETPSLSTETIQVNNIYEYCDIIYSCNVFLSTMSGQSVLASAIKGKMESPIIYTVHPNINNIKIGQMYVFNNISYI